MKLCGKCKQLKPLDEFHKQPSGSHGRFTWCKPCTNAYYRGVRKRRDRPETKRTNNYQRRYGLSTEQVEALLAEQGGKCAICGDAPKRPCVDHDHNTGKVRGILCHRCNIGIAIFDRVDLLPQIIRYLGATDEVH